VSIPKCGRLAMQHSKLVLGTDPKLQNLKVGAVYNFTDFFDDLTDRDLTISSELGR